MIARALQFLYYGILIRFIVYLIIGLRVKHKQRYPSSGPAIVVANHNSHLDAMVLASLLPLRSLSRFRPVAAADYFLSNPLLGWFATKVVGIVPIRRSKDQGDPLTPCDDAIKDDAVLVFFPEGTRGEPEQRSQFKKGIAHLAKKFPDVPITPVFIHGLGKSLPRGEALLVPFFCDVIVGVPFYWEGDIDSFAKKVERSILDLESEGYFPKWD